MKKNKNILLICLLLSFYSCSDNNPEYLFSDGINDDNEVVNEEVVKVNVNRVFFSPTGRLTNVVLQGASGEEINQDKYFDYTKGWSSRTDTLIWGIDVERAGEIKVIPVLGVPDCQENSEVEIILDNCNKQVIKLHSTGDFSNFMAQDTVIFDIPLAGRYEIGMKIHSLKTEGEVAYVKGLDITGKVASGLTPVSLRWRPSAVHCSFSNSENPAKIVMAVHENTIVTPWIDSYQPITTPFGYYGSTWDPVTQKFGGVNFSLWSFSANEQAPSPEKFSHIIAVGEGLYIDGFNHEGTGVKARGENPFEKMSGTTQILAVKKIPGNPYDIYYSYYWDTNNKKWKLYGCGKEYNNSGLKYLTTGAFVEVPGAAEKERSNHRERQVNFSGWLKDDLGNWYPINMMTPTSSLEDVSYKNWGKTSDNKFFMQMGGFDKVLTERPGPIKILTTSDMPEYLSPYKMSDLDKLPATIEESKVSEITPISAKITFNIPDVGTNANVNLYWDIKDGLTFVKGNVGGAGVVEWNNVVNIGSVTNNNVEYVLTGLKPNTTYYYRLQVKNDEGETWSFNTEKFTTLDGVIGEDIKIEINGGTASSVQPSMPLEKSFDGDYSTHYHSHWITDGFVETWPVTIEYELNKPSVLDYIVYYPRKTGTNGNFKEVDIFIATKENPEFMLCKSVDLGGVSTSSRIDIPHSENVTKVKFSVKSGVAECVSCAEMEFYSAGTLIEN